RRGLSTLIVSPTGTGKTLAAFYVVLDELAKAHSAGQMPPGICAVYVSPLRALSYDLEKNLRGPLAAIYGEKSPIEVGLRSGDTETSERDRQFAHPPHILLTTPESLCLLLSQLKWLPHLTQVRWVIVDEVHALVENKRGSHLSLSLERLEAARTQAGITVPLQRIGLSATVAPLQAAASYLVGADRACEIVDASAIKRMDLQVYSPLKRDPYPKAGFSGERLIKELGRLIRSCRTTLVFTNTRSGAESATYWLRENLPELAEQIECHHASLDRDVRLEVEDRLKRGELRAVVCSTSLELGIDIGTIDLVVMLSTPKGVSRAIQRTGRAGHSIREISRGLLMATNVHDLLECCATVKLARARHLDPLRPSPLALDVLAQHLMGMGCLGPWTFDEAYKLVLRAWPYRDLPRSEFDDVLEYLAGGGVSLRRQYADVFGRILVEESSFEARGGAARRDFLQNVGTIPSEGMVRVQLRNSPLGSVEERFISQLKIGDVFLLSGRAVRLDRMGTMECWVSRADGEVPTIPRWNASKFPLANRVAAEIRAFRTEIRTRLDAGLTPAELLPWIAERLDCGRNNAAVIFRLYAAQHGISEIPTADFLLIEDFTELQAGPTERKVVEKSSRPRRGNRGELEPPADMAGQVAMAEVLLPIRPKATQKSSSHLPPPAPSQVKVRHLFFHCLIGRSANDALSRVVALRLARNGGGNSVATADDYGFVLTCRSDLAVEPGMLAGLFSPDGFRSDLDQSLETSSLLKYHFRNAAQTGLMVYRNYFGEQKSVRKLQWSAEVIFNVLSQHEPNHILLREARRDAAHAFLDATRAMAYLEDFQKHRRPFKIRAVALVPPLAFSMYATKIKEALLVEDPRETLERIYHHWWSQLDPSGAETAG
ncbi:MAG TPA: DEAD/DEAH box helicase, partial [Candidatus Limnocylindria bacterium]|nr:DEAD/DEAH box helicase [Candidatus Limnocylindria bacterium]